MSSLFNPATETVVSPFSKPIDAASFKALTLVSIDGSGKISLINLDFDLYYPSKIALEKSWPKLSKNGIIIFDNYKIFDGETKAVDEFLKKNKIFKKLKKIKIFRTFYYLQK